MSRRKFDNGAPFQPISGAAYITGLSRGYIRKGCRAGTIPHVMVGKDFRVNMPAWLAQLDAQSATKEGVNQ